MINTKALDHLDPTVLGKMLRDKDAKKSERVMHALLQMKKIDIESLKKAYGQR